jgi:hypothetical protein
VVSKRISVVAVYLFFRLSGAGKGYIDFAAAAGRGNWDAFLVRSERRMVGSEGICVLWLVFFLCLLLLLLRFDFYLCLLAYIPSRKPVNPQF